ncbi:MAG: carbon-nitrogen hydrolase [Saprospiraceae bacterium]|nr:carbon-nitrogen hydrolase [Saprospiraceae bacterium]
MSIIRVGLVQHKCGTQKSANISDSLSGIAEAAEAGAELVVLQELHCSPYICQVEEVAQFDWADPIPGLTVQTFAEAAKRHEVVLVTSLFEKRAPGLYHNTAVVFEKDGSIAGKYRKMHIPDDPAYYEKFYFTPGDLGFEPIDTSVGRLGLLICWDQWYPEAARLMALAGAEVLIYPTAIGYESTDDEGEQKRQLEAWQSIQRGHAVANGLPLVSVNRTGFEADWSGQTKGIHFWGRSFVAGPQGEILFEAPQDQACVKVVAIDKGRTEQVRRIWPFFRDRRIDAYQGLLKRYLDQ